MTKEDQDTLCLKLISVMKPIIGYEASVLLELLMRIFRKRLRNCNEEQYTQIFMETSVLSHHIINSKNLEIPEDHLPNLQLVISNLRSIH